MKTILLNSATVVTLAEAKAYFRILDDDQNDTIQLCVDTSIAIAEQRTNRVLCASDFSLTVQNFETVILEKTPFVSITSVKYENDIGDMIAYTDYEYLSDELYDVCTLEFGAVPLDYQDGGDVIVVYEAGYDPTPAPIQSFVLAHAATMFENREMLVVGASVTKTSKYFYDALLDSYRIIPV
ncbi:MAG: hypothetical protein QM493_10330 [Sulfurovum sp.]